MRLALSSAVKRRRIGAFAGSLLVAALVASTASTAARRCASSGTLPCPAALPAAVLSMLTFMTAWNDFFWPPVVLTPENPTVQVALSTLASGYIQDFSPSLTGTAIATVPLLIVFGLLGEHIIGGIMQGAVKG